MISSPPPAAAPGSHHSGHISSVPREILTQSAHSGCVSTVHRMRLLRHRSEDVEEAAFFAFLRAPRGRRRSPGRHASSTAPGQLHTTSGRSNGPERHHLHAGRRLLEIRMRRAENSTPEPCRKNGGGIEEVPPDVSASGTTRPSSSEPARVSSRALEVKVRRDLSERAYLPLTSMMFSQPEPDSRVGSSRTTPAAQRGGTHRAHRLDGAATEGGDGGAARDATRAAALHVHGASETQSEPQREGALRASVPPRRSARHVRRGENRRARRCTEPGRYSIQMYQ